MPHARGSSLFERTMFAGGQHVASIASRTAPGTTTPLVTPLGMADIQGRPDRAGRRHDQELYEADGCLSTRGAGQGVSAH
jgi:hypothetical protein